MPAPLWIYRQWYRWKWAIGPKVSSRRQSKGSQDKEHLAVPKPRTACRAHHSSYSFTKEVLQGNKSALSG
jgi:hypothetical protein